MLRDPYAHYAHLRENHPVFWHDGMKSWVLTRYEDCRNVLRNHEVFARDRRRTGEEIPEFRQSLQTLDPPAQAPLRSLIMNAFHAQDLEQVGSRARHRVGEILRELAERDSFDWMREVAAPLALSITADLLGVPEPDPEDYVRISEAIAERMDAGLKPGNIARGDEARTRLNALAEEWFAAADDRPGVLRDIKQRAAKAEMPPHYVSNSTGMMFNASYGTVYATAGNVMLTLLQHPDALERLRDERLLTSGVNELIRYDGPAQGTSRVATRAVRIHDTTVEPGQIVLTLMAAANRDPREFPDPDRLVLDRTPNRHLGFGWGTHACVGALFGQVAIRELIVCLLTAPGRLRPAGTPTRRPTATVRSLDVLPVAFDR
ncbi:cytochrome P450 [Kitasatospora sp. NPDC093550]|uniref:cytochrome P450 n=1 Tax=Kitasatospora sp. NPDC093550 TaxID=3364089 RepID=UPI003822FD5F